MNAEPYDERTLRLVRETVDDTTAYVPDDDGVTAEHLCPPMSVRERRANPRTVANVAPRIPRQREGINVGRILMVTSSLVGGLALLLMGAALYIAWGFRYFAP
jgi:hypothetical protein